MNRREFSKALKVEIIKRATHLGTVRCEHGLCRAICTRFEIHHLDQDAMQIDKSRKLTAADGLLLCIPCHKAITQAQAPILAKVIRQEAKHLGVKKIGQKIGQRPKAVRVRKITFIDTSAMQRRIYSD